MSMDMLRWSIIGVWAAVSAALIWITVMQIKKHQIGGIKYMVLSLVLTLMSYGAWLIWTIEFHFAMIYVCMALFSILGFLAKKCIETHQHKHGKYTITSVIYCMVLPSYYMGQMLILMVTGVFKLIASMFTDMGKEIDANIAADEAADDYIRTKVIQTEPIHYDTELDLAYRDYIRTTGTQDTGRNRESFEQKYFNYVYGRAI